MPEVRIQAELRTEFGKGAARATRRAGRVPAIIYGHGAETRHLSLPQHQLMLALKTPNALFRLEGLGVAQLALPKAVQRDPLKGTIEHVDLVVVRSGEKVTVEIQIRVTGDVFSGGILDQQLIQVSIQAEATSIPEGIDVDVEGMQVGTAVHAKDLVLPAGAALETDPDALVLHVLSASVEEPAAETTETAEVPAPVAPAE
ncbi:MAG TPA: 50S ribosomal protein L25/general stress protein Ctc [Trebonia sp.]|nr:50S ribosomal protein L25/general stress protein Ctc [Trebonia sp.]